MLRLGVEVEGESWWVLAVEVGREGWEGELGRRHVSGDSDGGVCDERGGDGCDGREGETYVLRLRLAPPPPPPPPLPLPPPWSRSREGRTGSGFMARGLSCRGCSMMGDDVVDEVGGDAEERDEEMVEVMDVRRDCDA